MATNENYFELFLITVCLIILISYLIVKISKRTAPADSFNQKEPKTEDKEENLRLKHRTEPLKQEQCNMASHKVNKDDFTVFSGIKILIADDSMINQKVITSLLSTSGIEITAAYNGQEVLDILEKESNFSIIFMDLKMPEVDGYEAIASIRKNQKYNHIPIVTLSGNLMPQDIEKMKTLHIETWLEKPLNIDAFYKVLLDNTNTKTIKQSNISLKETKVDLDTKKGLSISGGDKDFYLEILDDFISKYSDSAVTLQKYINSAECESADKILLDISGIAANIGAIKLQQAAIELKTSIKNPVNLEYIECLTKYKRVLHKTCEAIKEYSSLTT